jgi:aerobic carbon-monoxide dehydrogenase large subunit
MAPMEGGSSFARFGSGREVRRVEDEALVKGAGLFTDDAAVPAELDVSFLRSSKPHARIVSVDTAAARAMPGVVAVITGKDLLDAGVKPIPLAPIFQRADGSPGATPLKHALAYDAVRFVGEAVAAVVAETRESARAAAEAIEVAYEDLPVVADLAQATAPGAPLVWPAATGNIAAEMRHGDAAATEAAFAKAVHVVALDLVNQRLVPASMEPRVLLAAPDKASGRLTVRISSQMPSGLRDALADALALQPTDIRVVIGDVGGGFGMKTGVYAEDIVVAYAARKLGRPVKWAAERIEEFLSATHGRDIVSHAELALDRRGRILALRVKSHANVGAYAGTAGIIIQVLIGPWVQTSVYDIKTIDVAIQAILTNTTPTGPYRGAGRPEAIYIIERLMDAAARKLKLDPAEIRRRNMIRPQAMPYTNPMGQTYDSGQFEKVLDQALTLGDWSGFQARWKQSKARGRLRGRGLSTFLEWTSGNDFQERVTVSVTGDGGIEIFTATQAMGQGIVTSYAQLAVDIFQVPIEKIRIVQGDTDRGTGFGSAGSRSLFTGGSAIKVAAEETINTAKSLASEALETAAADIEYREGVFAVAGTDRRIDIFDVAARQPERRIFVEMTNAVAGPSWPNGGHICEVEIDPDTGAVDIVSYTSVNDVGRVVNPMIVRGQLDGGAMQGIGQALCEHAQFDAAGQAMTASFMDYAMPRADLVGKFTTELDQSTLCKTNPLGVKGVGELGTIGATPTVVNAVLDALARAGRASAVDGIQMPLTPARIWQALNG